VIKRLVSPVHHVILALSALKINLILFSWGYSKIDVDSAQVDFYLLQAVNMSLMLGYLSIRENEMMLA